MSTQAEHWDREYAEDSPHFRGLSSDTPSNQVIKFVEYLKQENIPLKGKLLETGCGMGRNCNWLASLGFDVTGVDISRVATEEAKRRAQTLGLAVNYQASDISRPWPFEDNSMDFILDIATVHLLNQEQLAVYVSQVQRVLKAGGLFVIYTLDRSVDEEAQKLLKEFPGSEVNTYIIPEMEHTERTFTLEEVIATFPSLHYVESELIRRPTRFQDDVWDRYYWWVMFEK